MTGRRRAPRLSKAAKYAIRRQRYVNEQTSQIKHVLEKTEVETRPVFAARET